MPRTSRRGTRTRRQHLEMPTTYVVEIAEWDWSLSFGVDETRYRDDPYSEFRHFELRGKILRPTKLQPLQGVMHLLPDPRLDWSQREKSEPRAVGSLNADNERLSGIISMPADAVAPVVQMLMGNRFRFLVLTGEKLRYRKALIRSYQLQMAIDEDDLPSDD